MVADRTLSMLRRLLLRAGLVALPLVLGLLAAEWYASTTKAGNAALFVEDPELHVVRRPASDGYTWGNARWIPVHINAQGMRGEELPAERDLAETWVLCIGDSFTFGGGVETDEAWPQQLQAIVGDPGASKVRVLNAGANGWDTAWQRLYLEKRGIPRIHPQIVVLGFNWNDLEVAEDAPQQAISNFIRCETVPDPYLRFFARFAFVRSTHLFRYYYSTRRNSERTPTQEEMDGWMVAYRAKREQQAIEPERKLEGAKARRRQAGTLDDAFWEATDTAAWKVVREELAKMRELCSSIDAKLLVAQMPEPSWDGPGRFPAAERLDAMLASLGVETVDIQPDFLRFDESRGRVVKRSELWLQYDPFHPTPEGQRIFAERVAAKLRELGWIP